MSARATPQILVVDDDEINIKILQIQLEAKGYVVLTATSGSAALELVESNPPDLILLDIQMPRMDGFEVCQRIRAEVSTQFVPVVMVTALKDTADRIHAIQAGADDFISKPFDGHEIVEVAVGRHERDLVALHQNSDILRITGDPRVAGGLARDDRHTADHQTVARLVSHVPHSHL